MPISIMQVGRLPAVGSPVMCNGRLYRGTGKVVEIRIPDAEDYALNDNVKNENEKFPHIVVRPDNTSGLKFGQKTLIRYHAADWLNGLVKPYTAPAFTPPPGSVTLKGALEASGIYLPVGKKTLLGGYLTARPTQLVVNGNITARFSDNTMITVSAGGQLTIS